MVTSENRAPRGRNFLRKWARRPIRVMVSVGAALAAWQFAAPREANAETIEAALARAYENNPQLNAQRAIVRQTDESVPQALSGYRPMLTANASAGRQYSDFKNVIPPTPPFLASGASFEAKGLT